jgi:hypothetical protein
MARQRFPYLRVSSEGWIGAYVTLTAPGAVTADDLEQLGARVERVRRRGGLFEISAPPDAFESIARLPGIRMIDPIIPPEVYAGRAMTAGDSIHRANVARDLVGATGVGVMVGVISDDVAYMSSAQQTGDLPEKILVRKRPEPLYPLRDEGSAMMEIIHDIAPGAKLAFASGTDSHGAMMEAMRGLVIAGCNVIVDDLGWLDEPFFQDGELANVVDEVVAGGVTYISAAGNLGKGCYRGTFTPSTTAERYHAWDGVNDTGMEVTTPANGKLVVRLQWNDPWGGSSNDYDLFLYNSSGEVIARSRNPQKGYDNPREFFSYTNGSEEATYTLVVYLFSGSPDRELALIVRGGTNPEYQTLAGGVVGHAAARGAIAVGAVNAGGSDVADYSSRGPAMIYYPLPETRLKPELVAVDAVSVSGMGLIQSPFTGTSASAPHVAGIAALLVDVYSFSPAEMRQALTTSARDIGDPGPDNTSGYGMVDARAALESVTETRIKGTIRSMTWKRLMSPYHVTGEVILPADSVLVIDPGVVVLCDPEALFTIHGRLVVRGEPGDSVRFTRSQTGRWGGIRFSSGGRSELTYCRISGCETSEDGGAIWMGGNLTSVLLDRCTISGNSGKNGGAIAVGWGSYVELQRCLVIGNSATDMGGAVYVGYRGTAMIDGCTFSANSAASGRSVGVFHSPRTDMRNSILWGNHGDQEIRNQGGFVTVSYSNTAGSVFSGDGNISTDPLFVSALRGDYRLSGSSPSLDTGDPEVCDPDSTRLDQGYLFRWQERAELPDLVARPGMFFRLPVYGSLRNTMSVEFAFVVNGQVVWADHDGTIGERAWEGIATWSWRGSGDTVWVSMTSPVPVSLDHGLLIEIPFRSREDTSRVTVPMKWVKYPVSNAGGHEIQLRDGEISVLVKTAVRMGRVPAYSISPCAPNPFNPSTTIGFMLPSAGRASITVYNLAGQRVSVLGDGYRSAGNHRVIWDGRDGYGRHVASGVYFARLVHGGSTLMQRMTLVR